MLYYCQITIITNWLLFSVSSGYYLSLSPVESPRYYNFCKKEMFWYFLFKSFV